MRIEIFLLLKDLPYAVLAIARRINCYLIGGAVTSIFSGRAINDYDFYFHTTEDLRLFIEELDNLEKKYVDWSSKSPENKKGLKRPTFCKLMFTSQNAYSYLVNKAKIQVIRYSKFVGSPEEIWNYFDYTICMGAYSFKEDKFILHETFLTHIAQKRLVFNLGTEYPISSLIRAQKYIRKDYKINNVELVKLALTINKLEIKTYKDLKHQLMGIDTLFLKPVTDYLESHSDHNYDWTTFMTYFMEYIMEKAFPDAPDPENMEIEPLSSLMDNVINDQENAKDNQNEETGL